MALVLTSSSHQSKDPTATLQAALAEFERTLTTEQQKEYHIHAQNAFQSKPDAVTVMKFIAELDAKNHKQLMKSVAPRLDPILHATQQFVSIVDTFVSSNPSIAALVWGGVKTAILAASNAANFFDKVTSIVMTLGRDCPAYKEFALIYKDSVELQRALSNYYAALVRFAAKIIGVSQRSQVAHFMSLIVNSFDADFKPYQDQLAEASRDVRTRISIAAAQLVKRESEKNEEHRQFLRKFHSDFQARHRELRLERSKREAVKLRATVLDQLSDVDYLKPWRQAQKRRLPNTAEWFKQNEVFKGWQADRGTSILWCPGKMGIGKTVLVANIITVMSALLGPDQVMSHHFCRTEHALSNSARNILGTIARQLLRQQIDHADIARLRELVAKSKYMDCNGIVNLLLSCLRPDQTYYIIIDGLDACDYDNMVQLSESLGKLIHPSDNKLHILLSGRPDLDNILFKFATPKYRMQISPAATRSDVAKYIDTALENCLDQNKIRLANPQVILHIADVLHKEYIDHFLFAYLFIEELCSLNCENDILTAIQNPPRQIHDLLRLKLSRIRHEAHSSKAIKVLQLCGTVRRPLTMNEFGELISITILQPYLDRTKIPWDMRHIVRACHGLIHVDEEDDTIQYAHHSLRQHFFTPNDDQPAEFDKDEIDLALGQWCLTYLNFSDFSQQLIKSDVKSSTKIAPLAIGLMSIANSNKFGNDIARKLLQSRDRLKKLASHDISQKVEDVQRHEGILNRGGIGEVYSYYLLSYVQCFWLDHLVKLCPDMNSEIWTIFCTLVDRSDSFVTLPWRACHLSPSVWAAKHNHFAVLIQQVRSHGHAMDPDDAHKIWNCAIFCHNSYLISTLMSVATHSRSIQYGGICATAENNEIVLLEALLQVRNIDCDDFAMTRAQALSSAAFSGFFPIFRRLSAIAVKRNPGDILADRCQVIDHAAAGGYLKIIELLLTPENCAYDLEYSDDAIAFSKFDRDIALRCAAHWGRIHIVKCMLKIGTDVNSDPFVSWNAHQSVVGRSHHRSSQQVIAATAKVNPAIGLTPLQAAVERGHEEIVELLLEAGADVNFPATSPGGLTALQAATSRGHFRIVKRLLSAGADVNAPPDIVACRTALQIAAEHGHLQIVQKLFAVNSQTNAAHADEIGIKPPRTVTDRGHLR